jgi:TetR/AcrR family transcriptional repressor of mexJK operon
MNAETILVRPGRPKDSAKREEIVNAATYLFMEKGYALTSMEAVAKQANVSKLTIYSHFDDKSELFRAIIQNRCNRLGMPQTFLDQASLPPQEVLLQIAQQAVSIIFRADSIRLMRVVQAEAIRHPEIVQIYYEVGPRRIKKAFAELLGEFDRQGKLSIAEPERATEQFFSLLKGERLNRVLMGLPPEGNESQLAAHAQATVDCFLAAYRTQTTPSPILNKEKRKS